MKTVVLVVLSLVVQAALGWPDAPVWLSAVLVPMVFVVGPPLLLEERRWPHFALALGLAWDLALEPVVGPGAIAWSAAAVTVGFVVPLVADRSPRAWFAFGALGASMMIVVRHLALWPLGLSSGWSWRYLLISVVLTSLWCGLVGSVLALDLPARWRSHRLRKLR
jgi:hypothetical protein